MYLIDKVVRAKLLQGPIGVNNSEVINLEQERELRKKNIYYAKLAEQRKTNQTHEEGEGDIENEDSEAGTQYGGAQIGRNSKGEFVDDEEQDMDELEKENAQNE